MMMARSRPRDAEPARPVRGGAARADARCRAQHGDQRLAAFGDFGFGPRESWRSRIGDE